MKLPLKEPIQAKYLYISPDNIVQVLMPVVSGTSIGLDNTCKAVYSLQEFFGKGSNSNQKATLKGELLAYKEALESDLHLLGADALLSAQKQERLTQINAYLEVLTQLEKHSELDCLNQGFPSYPRPLEAIMQDRATSNLHSMVLRPTAEDGYLRSEAANPIFSVAHKSVARNRDTTVSKLQQALLNAYAPLRYESKDLKSQVIQQVIALLTLPHVPVNFPQLRQILTNTVQALLNEPVDFTQTQQRTPITQPDIDRTMGFTGATTPQEYIEALLGYCAPNLFDDKAESPFKTLTQAEGWSIATQFLLGIANIYGVSQGNVGSGTNFGQILDGDSELSKNLAQTLAQAQQNNQCIEDAALSWMNAHAKQLQLKKNFDPNDVTTIKETFATLYAEIKGSPHFDEFFVLDTQKKGSFFTHQGSICASFSEFACSPLFDLPQKLIDALSSARRHASTLSTEIPHQNPLVQGEVEITTTTLDNNALQALYERINAYKDAKFKEQLLAQLKQERPDFKPQIDAKQFLQHVAYGEQDEAEALLQKDPELAQELLKAHNIPFTDYSGRTFTCTAYEYAYWAKDTHMQRMLEKTIQQNEETRSLILTKVQAIEELLTPQAASGLFEQPRPRGLQYTTQDKEGKTITHCEAHFDLTPLKKALKHYVEEYDKNPEKSEADWNALDKIWIEEVGRAQRDVPAHIAQEYCHPNRSFEDVTKNKALLDAQNPANLKRQLKFYNYVTDKYDLWFCPGCYSIDSDLGFSFGILRGDAWPDAIVVWRGCTAIAACGIVADVAALEAIDEVRTGDLRQSLNNLSQPPTVQSSQSHGI